MWRANKDGSDVLSGLLTVLLLHDLSIVDEDLWLAISVYAFYYFQRVGSFAVLRI